MDVPAHGVSSLIGASAGNVAEAGFGPGDLRYAVRDGIRLSMGRKGVLMATFREEQTRSRGGWSRTRWMVLAAIAVAVIVAIVLLVVYSGGGSSGGGGGGY